MKIDCISDLHGAYSKLDGGDLLIVAGDLTARDEPEQYNIFIDWLYRAKYDHKIFIAGNHDGFLQKVKFECYADPRVKYLRDSGVEIEGIKIWGSPWTPTFYNWHFMKDRGAEIRKMWDLIPKDTEILITHGPAFGLCDIVNGKHAGCEELRAVIDTMPNLRLHVFGHIHEGYGTDEYIKDIPGADNRLLCINASIMNGNYHPVNKPISVEYTSKGVRLL
jgi:Icc-related predicted phosphoesterase